MKRAWLVTVLVVLAVAGFSCGKNDQPTGGNEGEDIATSKPFYDAGGDARRKIGEVLWEYSFVHGELAYDSYHGAKQRADKFYSAAVNRLESADIHLLAETPRSIWNETVKNLRDESEKMAQALEIEELRIYFASTSEALRVLIKNFGHSYEHPVVVMECSMAFDGKGAHWLQQNDQLPVENPYFGAAMLGCGSVTELLVGK